jgi:hypothetical protein
MAATDSNAEAAREAIAKGMINNLLSNVRAV